MLVFTVVALPVWFYSSTTLGEDPRLVFRALGYTAIGALFAAFVSSRVLISQNNKRTLQLLSQVETNLAKNPQDIDSTAIRIAAKMTFLEDESQRLDTLLDSMGEAVIAVDDLEKVVLANQVAVQRFGIKLGEAIGEELDNDVRAVLWSGEERTAELKRKGIDYSVTISPTFSKENEPTITGVIVLLHDVSKIRKLERIRQDFVANLSHELRTPIAVIQSSAETLTLPSMNLNDVAADFAETIFRHSERMGTLIESLLRLSQIEAAGDLMTNKEISTRAICLEVLENIRPLAEEKSILIHSDCDDLIVLGDPGGLSVVLQNLMENAIKYSEAESEIQISCKRADQSVRFTISDNGIGIDEKHLDRIFERFYRVDEGRSREIGGTGLGLAIVKHLVRALGGTIHVESASGDGSVFIVEFPT